MRRPLMERVVHELAALERGSASEGERRAAEWLAEEFRGLGCDVRIEEEPAHGGYWWPLGILNAAAALVALAGRRFLSVLVGAGAAAAVYDDVSGGRLWFRRAVLPHRTTWNVVAETGDRDAERTIVFIGHHDAAHTGLVFHPALPRVGMRIAPEAHARATQSIPIMYGVFLGPVITALAALFRRPLLRRIGIGISLGATASMADIGLRPVVPGANDNLSSVGVLVALADALRERPPQGVRVILLSTGAEESFMEGMQGFGRRHFPQLSRATTEFVCLECVGSPELCVVEGEGMLRMRLYPKEAREALARAGERAGAELTRGLKTIAASDALIPLRAGYRTCLIGGIDETKFPANYHWPSDTPDNLSWESMEAAAAVSEAYVRMA
ncbi:MAG: M28 family peptidase [Thermoleophilaceae bacterium]|nr:M28 family peptidase [Thermoleophilaceae bacterium]